MRLSLFRTTAILQNFFRIRNVTGAGLNGFQRIVVWYWTGDVERKIGGMMTQQQPIEQQQSNPSEKSAHWDLGRFVKTLSYFGVVPFLSQLDWFQQWFGSRANPQVDSTTLPYHASSPGSSSNFSSESGDRSMSPTQPIFDFTQPSPDLREVWGALDDVVMGGVSQSGMQWGTSSARFVGNVSTANSGGFASVRTRNFAPPLDLSGYAGIELRLKGDGNRYKFMLRSDIGWDSVAYSYSFDTTPDTWMTVQIPFSELVPVFRAKTVRDAQLDRHQIYAMQLMLSKFEYDGNLNPHFQPGEFQLEIATIQAYTH